MKGTLKILLIILILFIPVLVLTLYLPSLLSRFHLQNEAVFLSDRIRTIASTESSSQKLVPKVSPTKTISISIIPTPDQNTCNNLLVLIDKQYGMSASYTPSDLVKLSDYNIPVVSNTYVLRSIVVPDLLNLLNTANSAGYNLGIVSPYRSYEFQQEVYNAYVAREGEAVAEEYSALPGHSQHQLGTAIDFGIVSNGEIIQGFGSTDAGSWLDENAYKFGFYLAYPYGEESITGYGYEPWHFRYIGKDNALAVHNSGFLLEQYLKKYGVLPNC